MSADCGPNAGDGRGGGAARRPIRALLVSPLPPPPGGMETWTQTLVERGLPPPFEFELVDTKAFRARQQAGLSLNAAEARRNLRILRQVRRALGSGRFSVMHLNCALTPTGAPRNLAAALIARRAGVPYIAHLHGTFAVPRGGGASARFYRWAYGRIFAGAARILALGEPSRHAIMELGDFADKTIPLMPNFVDFSAAPDAASDAARRAAENAVKGGNGEKVPLKVMFTGALIEAKGVFTLVDVAALVEGARFRLVGDGPDAARAALLRRIQERGLQDRVEVIGPVSNREVVRMLGEHDAFLFPSKFRFEGFPISVAEAMAAGLPVAASWIGALPEMVDVPQGGGLFAPDDAGGYAKILTRLRDDPGLRLRMGLHNRQKARREYDYDVVVRRLCRVYSQAAAQGRGARGRNL